MSKINFTTFISGDCADYAEFLKKTCSLMESGENEVNYTFVESVAMNREPKGYQKIAKTGDTGHNSMNHGIALNEAFRLAEGDYNVFCDADVAITYKGWDKVVCDKLDEFACFGFDEASHRCRNFPSVFFFAFNKTRLGDVELDFRPKLVEGRESVYRFDLKDQKEAEYFGKKVGEMVKCDTGWNLPLKIHGNGFNSFAIKRVLGKHDESLLPFVSKKQKEFCLEKPTHMSEWHYDGELFGTHKQASRSHLIGSKWGKAWVDRVKMFFKNKYNKEV
jgi:glycosyltransferase involved in cell wall biosynthesis